MTGTVTELDVRALAETDEPAVVELLTTSLGGGPTGNRNAEFFAWKHKRNPFGISPGLVAVHDGRVVGVRLFMRWRLQAAAEHVSAVRAVDTATHPEFQGRGIFRRLTLELLDQLDAAGQVDLVFNTPNTSSRPGYLKMGWQPVGTLPVRLSPVRPLRFVRGARGAAGSPGPAAPSGHGEVPMPGRRPLPQCPFPTAATVLRARSAEVQQLLRETAPSGRLHTPLSLRYLNWRYAEAPDLDYRFLTAESAGRIVGLAFGRLRRRGPLVEFTVGDLVVRDGDRGTARRLLRAARRSGADHVALHTTPGTEAHRAALVAGYPVLPRGGIALVANPRRPLAVSPVRPESWRLSLGDLEVF
ncbi:MAG: GNAT family N-acetyltransferase [Propionibacteriales bacterium]|nr:GNAT family N-acetyltransferase [Propionibacteriales bacterium]